MNDKKMKRFIEVIVHNSACNLKCHYCYLAQQGTETNKKPVWQYSPEYIASCLTPERLGGYCCFNMCTDGETLISAETLEVIKLLAGQGHYVNIVTNGTISKAFDEISTWSRDICEHLTFLFSYHFLELERLNLLDRFFDNVCKVKDAGASFTIIAVLCDEYWDRMDDLQNWCIKRLGAPAHFAPYRDADLNFISRFSDEQYIENGKSLMSDVMDVHTDAYHKKVTEFCYAGDWFFCLDLVSGEARACYSQPVFDNLYENPERDINFCAIGNHCKISYCYNSHSRIGLGLIPEIDSKYFYADSANRETQTGEWFSEKSKEFYNTKLYKNNKEYSFLEKQKANCKTKIRLIKDRIYWGLIRRINSIKNRE